MKIKTYLLILTFIGVVTMGGCGKSNKLPEAETVTETKTETETETETKTEDIEYLSGLYQVEIEIENYGTISVELDADHAPISVTNFIQLASDGFYDGLTFHRIIEGFMMQGGDPNGNGSGGSDENIKGEFPKNGVDNPLSHTRGAISMARSRENDSASSQFFIVHKDSIGLDGDYAVFGYVTEGMDIVDQICEGTPVQDKKKGTVKAEDQPIITSIKVID